MNKKLCSFARLLALLIVIACVLAGCTKKDKADTEAKQAIAEATILSTESPTTQPTAKPIPTLKAAPSSTPTAATSPQPTKASSVMPTAPLADEPSVALPAEGSSNVVAADGSSVSSTQKMTTEDATSKEPTEGMFDSWFTAKTSIAYSSGTDSEWAYGNQRKEFTLSKPCYVRVGSSVVAGWHWGWRYGEGNRITISYRFTGAEQCNISISDGFVTEVETDDPNVIEFTRTIVAKGSEVEDVAVFQYSPKGAGNVSLEVIYDDQVKSQYDERNTVYFINEEDL